MTNAAITKMKRERTNAKMKWTTENRKKKSEPKINTKGPTPSNLLNIKCKITPPNQRDTQQALRSGPTNKFSGWLCRHFFLFSCLCFHRLASFVALLLTSLSRSLSLSCSLYRAVCLSVVYHIFSRLFFFCCVKYRGRNFCTHKTHSDTLRTRKRASE